jgi:hypothetical protein
MSLDVSKLEKAREVGEGKMQARCPACAEGGHDRKGEHLWIYPDGRFGCCVHPKDKEHRKRVFALVGEKQAPRPMRVKVAKATPAGAPKSISESLRSFAGTLGTGRSESKEDPAKESGTPGTHFINPYAYSKKEEINRYMCKDWEGGVLGVPSAGTVGEEEKYYGDEH